MTQLEETDAYRYQGHVLCEGCAEAERRDICDGSGRPPPFWDNCHDPEAWPQRSSAPTGTPCHACGMPLE